MPLTMSDTDPPDRRHRPRGGPRLGRPGRALRDHRGPRHGSAPGAIIEGHACLTGPIEMGRDNFVGHGAVLGKTPQHRGYTGEPTVAADRRRQPVSASTSRSTAAPTQGGGETVVGDRNMLMIGSHLGHDGRVGDDCTLVNGALVAGHCDLHDGCILSGYAAVQQRVRIGRLAMLGGPRVDDQGHPPVRPPAGLQLRHRPEPRRPPPRGVSADDDRRRSARRSGSSTRKAGPRRTPWSGSRPTLGRDPRGRRVRRVHPVLGQRHQHRPRGRPGHPGLTPLARVAFEDVAAWWLHRLETAGPPIDAPPEPGTPVPRGDPP